jgi:MFS family permease
MSIQNRSIFTLMSSMFFANLSDGIRIAAFSVIAWQLTGSSYQVALISSLATLIFMVASPFAGVIFDFVNRFRLMTAGNLGRAIIFSAMAYLVFTDQLTYPILIIIVIAVSILESFTDTGIGALIPQLVTKKSSLDRVNTLRTILIETSNSLAGPSLGGLVVYMSRSWTIFSLTFTYLIAGLLIIITWANIRRHQLPVEINKHTIFQAFVPGRIHFIRDIADGWNLLFSGTKLRTLLFVALGMNLFGFMGYTTFVVYVENILQLPGYYFGIILGLPSATAVLTGILNAAKPNWIKTKPFLVFCYVDFTLSNLVLYFAPTLWLVIIGLLLQGIPLAVLSARAWTIFQKSLGVEKLGRIIGLFSTLQIASSAIGAQICGILSETFNAAVPFLVSAITLGATLIIAGPWYYRTDFRFDSETPLSLESAEGDGKAGN